MFEKIEIASFSCAPFQLLGEEWTLITVGSGDKVNTMTASWGGLGVLWGAPMATIYVRPPRYTREILDQEDYFTLSFFGKEYRKELVFCGKESGRDVDKLAHCDFHIEKAVGEAPYIGEANLVLVCKKRYVQDMNPEAMPVDVKERWYPLKDYHKMYMGEIVEILRKV